MKTFKSREKAIIIFTLILVGSYSIDRLVVSPVTQMWNHLNESITRKQLQYANDRRLLSDQEQIKRDYTRYVTARRAGTSDSRGGKETRILKELETVARLSGVKISDMKPQTTRSHTNAIFTVILVVESPWDSLGHFIFELQRSPLLLQIEKATIQRRGTDTPLTGQFVVLETSNPQAELLSAESIPH